MNNISNPNLIFPGERIIIYNDDISVGSGQNASGKILYRIQPGNTLSQIALEYNTTVQAIAEQNDISNPNLIFAGQIIRIPQGNTTF